MPTYLYQNPKTQEIKEVVQGINDVHEYIENDIKWDRIFTVPHAAIDTQIDPFNHNDFVNKTSNKKGTIGNLMDESKALSEKREQATGTVDPVKKKYFQEYSKKRKNKKHPKDPSIKKSDSIIIE